MSKLKSAKYIEVNIELADMDLTQAGGKTTYAKIALTSEDFARFIADSEIDEFLYVVLMLLPV